MKGRYIVDPAAYLQFGAPPLTLPLWVRQNTDRNLGPGIAMLGKFSPTDVATFNHRRDEMERDRHDQFLLYPPRLLGCTTQQRYWGQFKVESTKRSTLHSSAVFDSQLEMDFVNKEILKALVENHERNKIMGVGQVNDVIEGKDNNLVILLHGEIHVGTGQ
jgi:hypothetical protein